MWKWMEHVNEANLGGTKQHVMLHMCRNGKEHAARIVHIICVSSFQMLYVDYPLEEL